MTKHFLDHLHIHASGKGESRRAVAQVVQADGRLTAVAGHAVELVGQPIRFDPSPVRTSEDTSALDPCRAGREPRTLLPKAVTPQDGDRIGIQRHDAASRVALRRGLLDVPAVVDELDRDHQFPSLQINVFPAKAARLPPPQTAQRDEMEEGVKLVAGDVVEEAAGLVRSPHHDRRRPFSGLPVSRDSLIGPHDRLGPTDGIEFYVCCWVEGDQLLRDGVVQRGPQRRPDMQSRSWPSDTTKRRHSLQCLLQALAGLTSSGVLELCDCGPPKGVVLLDLHVALDNGVEHLAEIGNAETVKPDVPDVRFEMKPNIQRVPRDRARSDLASCDPRVQPFADRHARCQRLAAPELSANFIDRGQRLTSRCNVLQQVTKALLAENVISIGNRKQCSDSVEVILPFRGRLVAGPAEGASRAVGAGRHFLSNGPVAVTALGELLACLADLLAGLGITACAAPGY